MTTWSKGTFVADRLGTLNLKEGISAPFLFYICKEETV